MASLPCEPNSGITSCDRLLGAQRALAEELPDQRGDEGLRGREDGEPGVDVGVAEGLVHEHLTIEREGHLAGGQEAVVDITASPSEQGVDGSCDRGSSCAGNASATPHAERPKAAIGLARWW